MDFTARQNWQSAMQPSQLNGKSKQLNVLESCNNLKLYYILKLGFPGGSGGKEFVCNARDPGSIPGSGRPPGEGNGNSLQYSCLENPKDRGGWQAAVHGITKSQTRLSD